MNESMAGSEPPPGITWHDTAGMPWGSSHIAQLGVDLPVKQLIRDPDTGMTVLQLKYAAGFTNPWHRHPCAHGMYVLDGILRTHQGDHGPGSFVWFPEGVLMQHGATPEADVTVLFITNKPFAIRYAFEDDPP